MSASDPAPLEPLAVDSSERIYDSPWCGLRRDQLLLADGSLQEHHVFEISPAVAIVPVTQDGSIVMTWQYRHTHGGTHWEVPAGRINDGEEPQVAAERELLEETGYRAASIERVAGFYPTNGISPHYAHIFVASGCERVADPTLDPCERLSVHVVPADEVRSRLVRGGYDDGFSALALLYHFARL